MVVLHILPRTTTAKVDISLLLHSQDEEAKKAVTTPSSATTEPIIVPASAAGTASSSPRSALLAEPTVTPVPVSPITVPSIPAKRLQPAPSLEIPAKKQSKWSAEEDALIIELRGSGMKWEDISKRLPGRSAISCRLHYQNYLERRSEWDEDRKNKLARLYERFKNEMWSKIAEEMAIPWRAAEAMHWQLGYEEMARRAGVIPFALQSNPAEPPHKMRKVSATAPKQRREGVAHGITGQQLPSVAELTAGVPAYASSQPRDYYPQKTSPKSPAEQSRNHAGARSGVATRSRR
ncbi:hypothetical protein AJ79_08837 [Helicocarpus griseus UAMH5409]|uniref:MYB DNA-binding domain-containing protein n=1 Tax=Helicocarpus griseus UAMH5409 TaxID=1447875 RepID=A0A2B7WGR4_9EURO|nr:hypothetical protein AJ79_08837 [Helicocarpus griseus UAMH5409]